MKKVFLFLQMCFIAFLFCFNCRLSIKATTADIYYFSDSSNCGNVVNSLVTSTSLNNTDISLVDWSSGFYSNYNQFINNYINLEDKIIIFEMAQGFAHEEDDGTGNTMPEKLEDLFSTWKENNCRIIFIGGTDETRYVNYNDFLDYVDFHIILDLRHVFMMNVFYYLEQEFGVPPHDFDLIFDSLFVYNVFGPNGKDIVKGECIIPYIRSRYRSDIENGATMAEVLNNYNANIYLPFQTLTSIYNITENPIFYSFEINNHIYDYDMFVVSASGNNLINTLYDYEILLNIYDLLLPHSLFFYSIHGVTAQNYINNNVTNVYQFSPNVYTNRIVEMITSFIFDDYSIWSQYDNWTGRCDVTHLLIPSGGNGSLHNFMGSYGDTFENCWPVIVPESEVYDLYYDDNSLY